MVFSFFLTEVLSKRVSSGHTVRGHFVANRCLTCAVNHGRINSIPLNHCHWPYLLMKKHGQYSYFPIWYPWLLSRAILGSNSVRATYSWWSKFPKIVHFLRACLAILPWNHWFKVVPLNCCIMLVESGWPSGLRRCVQVAVHFRGRGFESHFWQIFFTLQISW